MKSIKEKVEEYLQQEKDVILCVYDRYAGFIDGANYVLEELSNGENSSEKELMIIKAQVWLEKQGEQRPADFSDLRTWKYIVDAVRSEIEGIGQYLDSPYTEKVAKKLQKRFGHIEQPKQEWGIEDKSMLQRAVYYINYYQTHKADTQESYECINWLNSIKDRVPLYKEVIKK